MTRILTAIAAASLLTVPAAATADPSTDVASDIRAERFAEHPAADIDPDDPDPWPEPDPAPDPEPEPSPEVDASLLD